MPAKFPSSVLSQRQRELAQLVVEGLSNAEIAARLGLQLQTVKNRLSELYERTGVRNRVELAMLVSRDDAGK